MVMRQSVAMEPVGDQTPFRSVKTFERQGLWPRNDEFYSQYLRDSNDEETFGEYLETTRFKQHDFLGKEVAAAEFINKCDFLEIPDIETENCRVSLKKWHKYYAQIQLSMAVLNLPKCDFVVYSSFRNDFVNIIVPFDIEFSRELIRILRDRYFGQMFHEICSHG